MSTQELLQSIAEHLQTTASVKTVYGEPVQAEGRTIIPVARVAYGFGGGGGRGQKSRTRDENEEGEGAGGGVGVNPIGVIEITRDETRYIPLRTTGKVAGGLLAGLILGMWVAHKRRP